jgi:methionyl-tRNA synthetase
VVDVPYFLSKYDPDALCSYLTAVAPETRDTEACPEELEGFSWEDFVERNNNELVATARLSSCRSLGQPGQPHAEFRLQAL